MYIRLGAIWLTNPNDGTSERLVTSSRDLKIDGKMLDEESNPVRAVSSVFFARGNVSHTITFKVTRRFTTIAAAFAFAATHRSIAPPEGELLMVAGWPSEGQIRLTAANATLPGCDYDSHETPGVSVTHAYTLHCGAITQIPSVSEPIEDSTGDPIKDSTGAPITSS